MKRTWSRQVDEEREVKRTWRRQVEEEREVKRPLRRQDKKECLSAGLSREDIFC